jgi:hypothetical protein
VLRAGELVLDRARCRVRLGSKELSLTATEFRLLEFLMAKPDVVFSREKLLNAVWGRDRSVTDRTWTFMYCACDRSSETTQTATSSYEQLGVSDIVLTRRSKAVNNLRPAQ